MDPTTILSHLHRTDGSATFSQNGYTVIGAVNGPLEIQRRDELPEEAAIDVLVRPAAGVGGMNPCQPDISLYVLVLALTWVVFRYTGATSRIYPEIYPPPGHTRSKFPAHLNPDHSSDHKHTGECYRGVQIDTAKLGKQVYNHFVGNKG